MGFYVQLFLPNQFVFAVTVTVVHSLSGSVNKLGRKFFLCPFFMSINGCVDIVIHCNLAEYGYNRV